MNEDLLNNPENPCESNIFGVGTTLSSNRKGFTLAETLIAVVILGLITTLTVPSLINKQRETANITKIKKAMAAYDKALSQYYINNYYQSFATEENKLDNDYYDEANNIPYNAPNDVWDELDERYNNEWYDLEDKYINIFVRSFNIKERDSESPGIFQASDGLWWDVSPDAGKFFSVIVAFKREDLTAEMADSKENKAFYFIATLPNYAVTPITNTTFGKNMENLDILDYGDKNSYQMKQLTQMQKLYNYINRKSYVRVVDNICNSTGCCNNKAGKCLQFNNNHILVKNKEGLDIGVKEYNDSTLKSFKFYDSDKNLIVDVDYENTMITINKPNEDKRCYTFKPWVDNKCEGRTQGGPITFINEHAYSDPNYRWTQYGYSGCTVSKTTCPEE